MFLDKNLFKPIAQGYSYLPSPVKKGVRNITSNISHTVTIPNNLLQGNLPGALNETGRFLKILQLGFLVFLIQLIHLVLKRWNLKTTVKL